MKMLNKSFFIAQGLFIGLMSMSFNQAMGMEDNPLTNTLVIKTQDENLIPFDKGYLDFSQTLTNAFYDVDDSSEIVDVPVTTQNFNVLVPFSKATTKIKKIKSQKKYFQKNQDTEKFKILSQRLQKKKEELLSLIKNNPISIIELLNTVNYLNCPPAVSNALLRIIREDIEKKYAGIPTKDRDKHFNELLKTMADFDIPSELSLALTRKFIERYDFDESYYCIQYLLENRNVDAYALSFDKSTCAFAENGEIKIVDVASATLRAQLEGIENIKYLSFSPDGTMLAVASELNAHQTFVDIYLSCKTSGRTTSIKDGDYTLFYKIKDSCVIASSINTITFSPCSQKLLMSTNQSEVIEWDISTKEQFIFGDSEQKSTYAIYNESGKIIPVTDPASAFYRKKLESLTLKHKGLFRALNNLRAEQAFLFIQIMKEVVDTGEFKFLSALSAKEASQCYRQLTQNPIINAALKDLIGKRPSSSYTSIFMSWFARA
jgi:hypothetical protein